jgi:hypothetical protein
MEFHSCHRIAFTWENRSPSRYGSDALASTVKPSSLGQGSFFSQLITALFDSVFANIDFLCSPRFRLLLRIPTASTSQNISGCCFTI